MRYVVCWTINGDKKGQSFNRPEDATKFAYIMSSKLLGLDSITSITIESYYVS